MATSTPQVRPSATATPGVASTPVPSSSATPSEGSLLDRRLTPTRAAVTDDAEPEVARWEQRERATPTVRLTPGGTASATPSLARTATADSGSAATPTIAGSLAATPTVTLTGVLALATRTPAVTATPGLLAFSPVSRVAGTKHDLGSAGQASCYQCHVTHGAKGEFLWARSAQRTSDSPLALLCGSCHDGGVATKRNPATKGHAQGSDCASCHDPHSQRGAFLR